jgi:L-asparaginase II
VERGGDLKFGFNDQEIAIMCASHSGTDMHISVLERMHAKTELHESDLACGVHYPGDLQARQALKTAGITPNQLHHNCSGKHTGMLAHALLRGDPLKGYLDPQHPVQVTIRETLAEMVGLRPDEMPIGIDGCSAPVYAIPMRNFAHGIAQLADPSGLDEKRAAACGKITHAMMAHPEMVAGPGKFDTVLMQIAKGKVFSKGGAEGYQLLGVMPGVLDMDSPGLGIAIKISEGDYQGRARGAVSLTILTALGVLNSDDLAKMPSFGNIPVKNWRDYAIGEVRSVFSLDN